MVGDEALPAEARSTVEIHIKMVLNVPDRAAGSASTAGFIIMGALVFIFGKATEVVMKRSKAQVSITEVTSGDETKDSKTIKKMLTSVTVHPPSTSDEFHDVLHVFSTVVAAVGLYSPLALAFFLQTHVYEPMRLTGRSWMLAMEVLLEYLTAIDQSPDSSVTLSNVAERAIDICERSLAEPVAAPPCESAGGTGGLLSCLLGFWLGFCVKGRRPGGGCLPSE